MSIRLLSANENEIIGRYLVYRQGGFFGGGGYQILTIKTRSIELCDVNEKEENKEVLRLKDIVKIIPIKGRIRLKQLTRLISY